MPDSNVTPQDFNQVTGTTPFTRSDYNQFSSDLATDPFGLWWRTFVEGKGKAGETVSGLLRPGANERLGAAAMASDIRNAPAMDALYRQGLNAPNRQNPYNNVVADQSRAAQLALLAQMRAQQAGPSLAALQGQRGMAQAGQQGLMMGGRAGMLGAQNAAMGMAGDIGQARLAEIMRSQAAMGGAAGNLRGGDLRSADAQTQAGLAQLRQDEAMRQFYARQGAMLEDARNQALANRKITEGQLTLNRQRGEMDQAGKQIGMMGSIMSAGLMGGK